MENLTPGQMAAIFFGLVLAGAGAVNTIGSAAEKLLKAIRAFRAPNDEQNDRIQALEDWKIGVDEKLQNDHTRIGELQTVNRMNLRAIRALIGHGIDGNNLEPMQNSLDEIDNYLINR